MKKIKNNIIKKIAIIVFALVYPLSNSYGFARIISLTAASGRYSDETIIRLEDQATFDFDGDWDAYKLSNRGNTPDFNSILNGTSYAINSVPASFEEYTFQLNLKVAFNGSYTISTTNLLNSLDSTLTIILEDKLLKTSHILGENHVYEFAADTTDLSTRFVLHYIFKSDLNQDSADNIDSTDNAANTNSEENLASNERIISSLNPDTDKAKIEITVVANQIQINLMNGQSEYATIGVINMEGKVIYLEENVLANSSTAISLNDNNSGSIYIVRVISGNKVVCKKIYI